MTPPQFDNIPQFLREIPRWVMWQAVPRADGKIAKVPKQRDGSNASSTSPSTWCTFEDARAAYGPKFSGVGLVLDGSDGLVGVDLDHCIETSVLDDSEVYSALADETLAAMPGYWETSPSGEGVRGFIMAPGVLPSQKQVKDEAGARECYSAGRYLTVTGSVIKNDPQDGAAGALRAWLDTWMGGQRDPVGGVVVVGDGSLADFLADGVSDPVDGWDLERVRAEIVPHLDPECEYEQWLATGMALFHQGGGDEDWFDLWESVYQGGTKYTGPEYSRPKWESFGGAARPVTLRTLLKQTSDARRKVVAQKSALVGQTLIDEVLATIDEDALETLCRDRQVLVVALAPLDLTKLTNKVRAQLRAFPSMVGTPAKALDALVRRFLAPPVPTVRAQQPMPAAFRGWVFVTQMDKFFNVHSRGDALTRMGFNALMNREVPPVPPPAAARPAADMCTDLWGIKVVDRLLYAPGVGEVFTMNGREYANLYDPDGVPAVPDAYSAADLAAIEAVKRHLHLMFQDEREENIMLGWLAHNVQFPGRIIGWAPFIPGEPGVGKTFFSRLLRATMGVQNVSEVNVASIATQFKGWAAGAAVNVLEEVKLHGTNRYDVMNNLKPYITNLEVPMERKGQDSCMVPNFTNYLLFSNFLNGIPIDNSERRYCCLPSKLTTEDGVRLLAEGHFARLFDQGVDSQAGGLRKWLLEVEIVPEVLGKRAPVTEGRAETIAMGESEAVEIGKQVIEDGAVGVTATALSAPHFAKALRDRGCHIFTSTLRDTLVLLGFHRRLSVGNRADFKWRGKCVTVYVRDRKMTADDIRAALDASKDAEEDVL